MSKQPQPAIIGAFVVGAVALALIGLLVFGSGGLLEEKMRFTLFFDSSVKGLRVGSPVNFRGVPIGQVSEIKVKVNPDSLEFQVQVDIETNPDAIIPTNGKRNLLGWINRYKMVEDLIEKGLRAQLEMQSLVTGQLIIELDFNPSAPANFVGKDLEYQELPTIPSSLEELTKAVGAVPFKELVETAIRTVEGLEKSINASELGNSVKNLDTTLIKMQQLVENLDAGMVPLTTSMNQAVADIRNLVSHIDQQVKPISGSLQSLAQSAESTLNAADSTLLMVNDVVREDSQLQYDLQKAMREFSAAARSIRILAETLEKQPDALLRGKSAPGVQP